MPPKQKTLTKEDLKFLCDAQEAVISIVWENTPQGAEYWMNVWRELCTAIKAANKQKYKPSVGNLDI